MKKLVVGLAVLPLLALVALFAAGGNSAPPADASHIVYTVEQWGSPPVPVLPLQGGPESVEDFYGYNPVTTSTTALTVANRSHLFLYVHQIQVCDPAPGDHCPEAISLVIIHDKASDGSGGEVDFQFSGLPATADFVVWDDPHDIDDRDTYSIPSLGSISVHWQWSSCCTDGGAIQGGLEEEFCITVDPNFIDGIGEGIGNIGWEFITFPTPATPTLVWLDMQKPVTIRTPLGVCPYVGGTVELLGQSESPAGASESSARDYTAPLAAAIAAGALVVVAAGGWYVRRRRVR